MVRPSLFALLAITTLNAFALSPEVDTALRQRDYQRAATLLAQAADQGSAEASLELGKLYSTGRGVKRDLTAATTHYRRAAEAGLADAQYLLGFAAERGKGMTRSRSVAAQWYRKAAAQQHALAAQRLRALDTAEATRPLQQLVRGPIPAGYELRVPPDTPDDQGRTALELAIVAGQSAWVQFLLANGANPEQQDANGNSMLHLAVIKEQTSMVSALLNAGARPASEDGLGNTALHRAIASNQPRIAKQLLAAGADPKRANAAGLTSYDLARQSQNESIRSLLGIRSIAQAKARPSLSIDRLRQDNKHQNWPDLALAAWNGDTTLIEQLLAQGADINAQDDEQHSALSRAVVRGRLPAIQLLLQRGARPDLAPEPLLHLALQNHHEAILADLIQAGACLDCQDTQKRSPLMRAVDGGDLAAVKTLMKHGVPLNQVDGTGATALAYAIKAGQADALKSLLERGADASIADRSRRNPLWWATKLDERGMAAQLLRAGARATPDAEGISALHWMAQNGDLANLQQLQADSSALNEATQGGNTPLILAARHGRLDTARWLLTRQVAVNQKNALGETALTQAVQARQLDIAQLLLGAGANPYIKDIHARSPMDLAMATGQESWQTLFEQHRGSILGMFR